MKKILILLMGSFIISSSAIDTVWIDNSLSEIKWIGNKISGSHDGKISIMNGYILKNKNLLSGGEIIVDMNSITVDDIEHPDWNLSLVEHLKNEDFFDVEKFPTSKLKILSSKQITLDDKINSNIEILGELTIKGIMHEISIIAYVDMNQNISNGELIIDRTKWGIKYGSSSFFKDLGDRAIYDDFILNFKLTSK